jgi:hypothetical protein
MDSSAAGPGKEAILELGLSLGGGAGVVQISFVRPATHVDRAQVRSDADQDEAATAGVVVGQAADGGHEPVVVVGLAEFWVAHVCEDLAETLR